MRKRVIVVGGLLVAVLAFGSGTGVGILVSRSSSPSSSALTAAASTPTPTTASLTTAPRIPSPSSRVPGDDNDRLTLFPTISHPPASRPPNNDETERETREPTFMLQPVSDPPSNLIGISPVRSPSGLSPAFSPAFLLNPTSFDWRVVSQVNDPDPSFGSSVEVASDVSAIAVAKPNTTSVCIFNPFVSATTWFVIGDPLDDRNRNGHGKFLSMSTDGRVVATGSPTSVTVWEFDLALPNRWSRPLGLEVPLVTAIALSQSGTVLTVASDRPCLVQTYRYGRMEWNREAEIVVNGTCAVHSIAMSFDAARIAVATATKIVVYEKLSGVPGQQMGSEIVIGNGTSKTVVSMPEKGYSIAVSNGAHPLRVWEWDYNVEDWQQTTPNVPNSTGVVGVSFADDSGTLAAIFSTGLVRVYSFEVRTFNVQWTQRGSDLTDIVAKSVSLSYDGRFLTVGGNDLASGNGTAILYSLS